MNKSIIWVIVVAVLIGGGVWWYSSMGAPAGTGDTSSVTPPPADQTVPPPAPDASANPSPAPIPAGTPTSGTGSVKEFVVSGQNFSFTPSRLTVNKGDTVKITFKNLNGFHDFKIDEFNVATPRISGGQEATVTFTADKTGTFDYYCSVGDHRAAGMQGTLTVQ